MTSAAAALANTGTTGATTSGATTTGATTTATTGATTATGTGATTTTAGDGTNGTAATTSGTSANEPWFSTIPAGETRTWVEAKGWKDPAALAESAYNLEKLIGFDKAGRTIVVPKDDAPPEERRAFLTKLGVPETPDGYKLPVPEGADPAFAKTAAQWMHEAGIPPKQAELLATKWNEHAAKAVTADQQAAATKADQEFSALMGEWGKDADARLEVGRRAAAQFIPAANPQERQALMTKLELAMGTKNMLTMFAEMGRHLGEHTMIGNGQPGQYGAMTPAQAQAKISALKMDPTWTAAYVGGDKGKLKEMTDLMAIANGVQPGS
jgi:hypothetical protein